MRKVKNTLTLFQQLLLERNKTIVKIDCIHLIQTVIEDLKTVIQSSDAKVIADELPTINVFEVEMRQLFQNLISNAIKFRKKNIAPEIHIRSEKLTGKWKFSVSDNGIGIKPSHFERIFNIFQRLHKEEEYEGYGIGLANCKKIVELHGGEIWVESVLGEGATFNFTISEM